MLGCKHTRARDRALPPSHVPVTARREDGLCQRGDGVTLWLCLRSRAPAAPASPPNLSAIARPSRGGPNLGWRVELETLSAALGSIRCGGLPAMPNPTT
ncbi:hypothetical protein VZT92_023133 [Zoarces viviparus]|uniref:Uncharacterized protein n=1 Tax=Zoarces viviparus TaxID=48416 RepID=A0AAW1E5B5_ZOAVI